MEIVHVTQQQTTRRAHQFGEEFPLAHRRCAVAQHARRVFQRDGSAERFLHLSDVRSQHSEALLGVRQREQIVEIDAVRATPGDVLRDEGGLDLVRQLADPAQVRAVDWSGASERQPDAVQGNSVVAAQPFERAARRAAAEVILGMHLEDPYAPWAAKQFVQVRSAQADTNARVRHLYFSSESFPPTIFSQVPLGTEIQLALSPSTFET